MKVYQGNFNCNNRKLSTLFGVPDTITGFFCCTRNFLTDLHGMPKNIWDFLNYRENMNLIDLSDIWDSKIGTYCYFELNQKMAILPIVKFNTFFDGELNNLIKKHCGSSKQNIIDLQYDLIENGFEENARWKPI